jgi:hypothetical protein
MGAVYASPRLVVLYWHLDGRLAGIANLTPALRIATEGGVSLAILPSSTRNNTVRPTRLIRS